jgi:hypothetical protein
VNNIDDYFRAREEAYERKYGPADADGLIEKALSGAKKVRSIMGEKRICEWPGCGKDISEETEALASLIIQMAGTTAWAIARRSGSREEAKEVYLSVSEQGAMKWAEIKEAAGLR